MSATRSTLGLALLVTAVLILSSLGLAGLSSAAHPASPAPSARPTPVPSTSSAPLTTSSGTPGTANALLQAKTPAPAPVSPAALPTPSGRMSAALSELHTLHVPLKYAFLPNLNANPNPTLTNGHINFGYASAPAPLGVAEYGLSNTSGTITPYDLSTPSVEGSYDAYQVSGLSMDISGPDEYGVQLNSVLQNVTLFGTTGYQFWTQNVIEYSTYSHQIFFVSNIWNFSSNDSNLDTITPNIFYQIGPNATVAAPEYYYSLGGPITISYPFNLELYLNSTLIDGRDAVFFNFSLSNTLYGGTQSYSGSYDHAIFNSTVAGGPAAPAPAYVASGDTYTKLGLPADFEMVMGGPGGGSNFDILAADAYFGLQYWNSTTDSYQVVPSAYDFGSETGETSYGGYMLWGTGDEVSSVGYTNAFMNQGPSILQGLWNASTNGGGPYTYGGYIDFDLNPSNAFVFMAPGSVFNGWSTATDWSLFSLAPYYAGEYELDPGTWTIVVVMANYDPIEMTTTVPGFSLAVGVTATLAADRTEGVYTPLWAFNNTAVENISTVGPTSYEISNNQYGPIGYAADYGVTFPWFGLANDYLFPVFPGIFLWNTTVSVSVNAPSSFQTYYSGSTATELEEAGFPTSNDLQMLFWNDSYIALSNAPDIGGWWYSGAYFGPANSAYNVVFWNTSYSTISGNTFDTGGNALYLYGGSYNLIDNNTFEQSIPVAPNPYASLAGTYGSVGLFEADYGNASFTAAAEAQANDTYPCIDGGSNGYCDLIFNNIFLTEITADSPLYDPYYFYEAYPTCPAWLGLGATRCYFDESWNVLPGTYVYGELWATNILGGPELGGNFWWNYGTANDPYNEIPYDAASFGAGGLTYIEWGGDYLPLTLISLYHVEFVETGLPAGTEWNVGTLLDSGVYETAYTISTSANLTLPIGTYTYYPTSFDIAYAAYSGSVSVLDHNEIVDLTFLAAYSVTFTEHGLPTGTEWLVDLYNATTEEYVGFADSDLSTVTIGGVLPGDYLWVATAETLAFEAFPDIGEVDVTGNANVALHYFPVNDFTVNVHGLPAGAEWALIISNATFTSTVPASSATSLTLSGPSDLGPFNWTVYSNGYVATPSSGTFSLATNSSVTITFAAPATITFTESGLASGAAWTVWLTQNGETTARTGSGSSIVFPAAAGVYNYTVSAPGYTTSGSTGSGTLPSGTPVDVVFSAIAPAAGTLSVTVTTSGATATVNGAPVTTPFSQSEAPGIYAIVVSKPGYVTYYNNVTVASGAPTSVSVTLTPTSSSSSSSSSTSGLSSTAWLLIALLAALAVIFLITTLLFARKGRNPPPPATAPPPAAASSPPPAAGAVPAWSEGQAPPGPPPGAS